MRNDGSPEQIIAQYRSLATEAQDAASSAMADKYQEAYRKMAQHWSEPAREIEVRLGWPENTLR